MLFVIFFSHPEMFVFVQAIFKPPKPIRGGIPICFPQVRLLSFCCSIHCFWIYSHPFLMQFSNIGTLEQHGFARNRVWAIDPDPPAFPPNVNVTNRVFVDLLLKPTEEDLKIWPHRYILYNF